MDVAPDQAGVFHKPQRPVQARGVDPDPDSALEVVVPHRPLGESGDHLQKPLAGQEIDDILCVRDDTAGPGHAAIGGPRGALLPRTGRRGGARGICVIPGLRRYHLNRRPAPAMEEASARARDAVRWPLSSPLRIDASGSSWFADESRNSRTHRVSVGKTRYPAAEVSAVPNPASHEPRDDLSRYVQDRLRELGMSYRDVSFRAIDPGTRQRLPFQWIHKLARNQLSKTPEAWQLCALAQGLEAPEDVIKALAARQWLDYEVATLSLGPGDFALYLQWRDLPAENKEALRVLVQQFVRQQEKKRREREAGETPG
jgi:hypothetical protein